MPEQPEQDSSKRCKSNEEDVVGPFGDLRIPDCGPPELYDSDQSQTIYKGDQRDPLHIGASLGGRAAVKA